MKRSFRSEVTSAGSLLPRQGRPDRLLRRLVCIGVLAAALTGCDGGLRKVESAVDKASRTARCVIDEPPTPGRLRAPSALLDDWKECVTPTPRFMGLIIAPMPASPPTAPEASDPGESAPL